MNGKEVVLVKYTGKMDCFDQLVPDLGIAYLMASLENAGIKSKYFDLNSWNNEKEDALKYIQETNPMIVGFKIENVGNGLKEIINLANEIKKISSSILVAGGPIIQLFEEICYDLKEFHVFDALVYGEGEKAIVEIYNALIDKASLKEVPNTIYREEGKIVKTKWELFDVNEIIVTWNGINLKDYFPILPINMKRGCENACSFCSHSYLWGKKREVFCPNHISHGQFQKLNSIRLRNWDNIVQEIENDYYFHGIGNLYIVDSTPNISLLSKFADYIIENDMKINWFAFGRFDSFNHEILSKLKQSGLVTLYFGWESGDERILKRMYKRITLDKMKETHAIVKNLNIHGAGSFIVGHPGENEESIKKTLCLIEELNLTNYSMSAFRLTPGSYISVNPSEYNIILPDNWKQILLKAYIEGKNELETDYYLINGMKNTEYWNSIKSYLEGYDAWKQMRIKENMELIHLLSAHTGKPTEMLMDVFMNIFETKNKAEMNYWLNQMWIPKEKEEKHVFNRFKNNQV